MDLHLFRSTAQPIEAFTDSRAAEKLAPDLGPWDYVRPIPETEEWTHDADRSAVIVGVELNGFFLWDRDGAGSAVDQPVQRFEN